MSPLVLASLVPVSPDDLLGAPLPPDYTPPRPQERSRIGRKPRRGLKLVWRDFQYHRALRALHKATVRGDRHAQDRHAAKVAQLAGWPNHFM